MDAYHHFTLTDDLIKASDYDEVLSTLAAMKDFDLCHLPYDRLILSFRAAQFVNNAGWFKQDAPDGKDDLTVTVMLINQVHWAPDPKHGSIPGFMAYPNFFLERDNGTSSVVFSSMPELYTDGYAGVMRDMGAYAAMVLVATLACKNVGSQTSINKRAARGIGHGKFAGPSGMIYLSTTRLTPPLYIAGGGVSPRPHMRRGHVHSFRTGVDHQGPLLKKFIGPIFVNGKGVSAPLPTQAYKVDK